MTRLAKFPSKTEIRNLQLSIPVDQQVIGFQVLRISTAAGARHSRSGTPGPG